MISHVHIGVGDFDRGLAFYTKLAELLSLRLKFVNRHNASAGWMPKPASRPLFLIGLPFDGEAAGVGNGQMVAFLALNPRLFKASA